jgi:glycosyltransferase involved in cell wall biosynthesis
MVDISTIIPCFNQIEEIHNLTQMAVESINKAEKTEMIIIDNASTFGTGMLREMADIYVRNTKNIGYPAAVNQGLALANGEILCISNNDVRVPENIFKVGREILKDPKVGSVHFKMIPYDQEFNFGDKVWITGKERWCTSSFFLIKREALPKGNYDTSYGAGGYDDWRFWHLVRHINGWITAYTNKSAYQHWGSWTLRQTDQSNINKNREKFKDEFGEYPEDIWNKKYPEQMKQSYYDNFD